MLRSFARSRGAASAKAVVAPRAHGPAFARALTTACRTPRGSQSSIKSRRSTPFTSAVNPRIQQLRTFSNSVKMASSTRTESDAFGEIQVPSDKYWGAQTERSLENFKINQPQDRMPPPIVRAFGVLKGAAAKVNVGFGLGRLLDLKMKYRCRSGDC